MKKIYSFCCFLLLAAGVMAGETTHLMTSYDSTNKVYTATDNQSVVWNLSTNCSTSNQLPANWTSTTANDRGICFSKPNGVTVTSNSPFTNVTKVVVRASSNMTNVDGTISITIGGTTFGTTANLTKSNHSTYEFTSATPVSGVMVLTLNQTASSIWIAGLKVTTADSGNQGGDPDPEPEPEPEPTEGCSVTSPVLGYEAFGLTPNSSGFAQPAVESNELTFEGITLIIANNDGTDARFDETLARVYQKNTMTITAPATCKIVKIELNRVSGGDWKNGMTVNPACASYNDGDNTPTWTGNATSVTFTPGGTHRLASVTVYLDKKVGSFKIGSTGYSTYYTDFAFEMPANVEGKIMELNEGVYEATGIFAGGDVVPANTALLLNGTAGTYNLVETATAADEYYAGYAAEHNLLKGTLVEATTTGGTVYYMLSYDSQDGLGWYYGAEGGAAFTCGAHKAYLALNEAPSQAPAVIRIVEETETATNLENVEAEQAVKFIENGQLIIIKNGVRYNALGQVVR